MSDLGQMKDYLNDLRDGKISYPEGQTHVLELFTLMKSGLDDLARVQRVHYTVSGLTAMIFFADGKKYSIELKEIK